jgi:hypothetical protein
LDENQWYRVTRGMESEAAPCSEKAMNLRTPAILPCLRKFKLLVLVPNDGKLHIYQ